MISRRMLNTLGATALGIGIVVGGGNAIPNVLAQEAPATTEAPAQRPEGDPEARFAEAYDQFVAALASELNAEDAAVDAAIRTALKAQVAVLESDGVLDAEQVAEIQQKIDESEAPLGLGMGGPGGFGGRDGMHGFTGRGEHRGSRGGSDGRGHDKSEQAPGQPSEGTPATAPSADDAADQSAPDSAAPVEEGVEA